MRVSDKAIVLQTIKHGDKKCIIKLFTKAHGTITTIAYVGNSPSSKVRTSAALPLSLVEVELIIKQNKDIHQLTEAKCYYVSNGLSHSISKLSIAQFLNEILLKSLKEQGANDHLFEFIETCIKYLNDSEESFVNLHLYFLNELSKYLGFEPQNNYSSSLCYFDCREGKFTGMSLSMPLGLNAQDSKLFSEFLKIHSLKVNFDNSQRKLLLEILLAYYKLHVPAFNDLRSLDVLREIMAD